MNYDIVKYPRTPHLEGSRLQPGDEDLSQIPFSQIAGRTLAVEEKFDGANTGVSFDDSGRLLMQSRGHYLRGGGRERHYEFFKQWCAAHYAVLYERLGSRYVMYGEWMSAKHAVFYDRLPHFFLEFDIYDREEDVYLDTPSRRRLLEGAPVVSARVLRRDAFKKKDDLLALVGESTSISENYESVLRSLAEQEWLDPDVVVAETNMTRFMEGLYIKVEENGIVADRLKFVRASFAQSIIKSNESSGHWIQRPIVPNLLRVPFEALLEPELPANANFD